jgi:hypothetical protein
MARPSYSDLVALSPEELHYDRNEEGISMGLLHFGLKDTILRKMIPIGSDDQWEKCVTIVMSNYVKCLDMVVWKESIDHIPHVYSLELGHQAPLSICYLSFRNTLGDVLTVDVKTIKQWLRQNILLLTSVLL